MRSAQALSLWLWLMKIALIAQQNDQFLSNLFLIRPACKISSHRPQIISRQHRWIRNWSGSAGPESIGGTPCRATTGAGAGASWINHHPELHGLSYRA